MLDKLKKHLKNVGEFFTSLSNFSSYSDTQKEINTSITSLMQKIDSGFEKNEKETLRLSSKMDKFSKDLTQAISDLDCVKEGLQMELFESLQNLHARLIEQHWASMEEKQDADRYYTQIHKLGKDGWSERYYNEILDLPESKEEWYKRLTK